MVFRCIQEVVPQIYVLLLAAMPAAAQGQTWYLLAREEGCVETKMLASAMRLPRPPVSPEDFAQMMRERGEQVEIGPLEDSPPELVGKVVQVKVGNGKAPVFAVEGICRGIIPGR